MAALELPHVTERLPFGPDTLAFEIGGKMFCLCTLAGEWDFFNLKVHPELGDYLRERYPDIFLPAYHMNKRHWVSVKYTDDSGLSPITDDDLRALISHSRLQTIAGFPRSRRSKLIDADELRNLNDTTASKSELTQIIEKYCAV